MNEDKVKALVVFQQRMRDLKQGRIERLKRKERGARKRARKRAREAGLSFAPALKLTGD